MTEWIRIARAEVKGEKSDIINDIQTFDKCKRYCEKTKGCNGITYIFKQCKLQSGSVYVDADILTVNSLYEGGIFLKNIL